MAPGNSEDEWELREVRRPQGTHRSRSTETPGADRELLRENGTNRNLGPSESRAVDEEALRQRYQGDGVRYGSKVSMPPHELTTGQRALLEAITVVVREVVVPVLRDVAVPAAKTKLSEMAERRRAKALQRGIVDAQSEKADDVEVSGQQTKDEVPAAPEVEVAEPVIEMRRSELSAAQLELRITEEYADRLRWLLAHAVVSEEDSSPELEQTLSAVLEGRADELDEEEEETVAEFISRVNRDHGLPADG